MASLFTQPSSSPVLASASDTVATPSKVPLGTSAKHTPLVPFQHHYAHILSCMAKHQLKAPVLGVAWDGNGAGKNSTLWGGEFLQPTQDGTQYGFERVAHFLPYYLPGGESCSLEPRRSALGLLYGCYGEAAFEMTDLAPIQFFTKSQLTTLQKTLTQKVNVSATSSVGRMFDGVASLLNLHHYVGFEGQAALTLEFAATQSSTRSVYPFTVTDTYPNIIDWRETFQSIVEDCRNAVMTPVIAAKFHNTLVEIVVEISHRTNNSQIVLAGSCFQNKILIERAIRRLSAEGFTPYWI
ncbi:hypothetical protein S7335_4891 [Synechococcus sp. PCC 7335]|uniref:Kae1-like domain-containing protein n=1 Tax=Synechococcus sp. (strain ATCC 29403 / PCC 7335) TaxID=91464 RepID=UPI00017ED96F|nr:hypothetical protein [Synechococcus sp. PCC 7335]EDX87184.1 hypothetical protein S7335_4891 [Synechococcus sp. PCC 7335]